MYYAADDGDNNNHRLYVLHAPSPTQWFEEAPTGYPHGQLMDSTNNWAIDPDVFIASDGQLYPLFSLSSPLLSSLPLFSLFDFVNIYYLVLHRLR